MYIAFPMIKVSNIVKSTKKGEYDDIPPLEGGCKEVQDVYNTFAKLNKIVKISNTSFFSGKLDLAHHFMSDALVLYRKINDRKAIGVTCNNLANTLFAIQYERLGNLNCCDTPMTCYVAQALALYDEALNYSQRDFEGAEGDLKVDYAMQLSDRLFNRGLYYLFIDGFSCAPDDSRERGYNDINFSRNLHDDIRDYLLENKQLFAKASPYFSRLLRRINCLAAFYDDVGLRDIWDASTLLEEANQLVAAAVEASSNGNFCPLFQEINRSGRQQQLDNLQILLALKSGDDYKAARTGMRMLVEDVYLIESAFTRAAEAVLRYMKECPADETFSKRSIECARSDFRAMVKSCKKESLEIGKNAVFVFEINPSQWKTIDNTISTDGGELLVELNKQCLGLYDNCFQEDDEIGIVANTVSDAHSVEIGRRDCNEGRQRTFLNLATSSSSSIDEERPSSFPRVDDCFPIALQMLIDSSVSLQSDSYLVWVTDGCVRREEPAMISLRDQIEQLNQERSYQVHVLVICLNRFRDSIDCESDNEDNGEDLLQELGSVTKKSAYLSPDSNDELVSAFQWVSCILSENRTTSEFISFLTMEKF